MEVFYLLHKPPSTLQYVYVALDEKFPKLIVLFSFSYNSYNYAVGEGLTIKVKLFEFALLMY